MSCKFEGCPKKACYNFEGETKVLYCFTHKKAEMINVKYKRCIYENCQIITSYNFEGENKRLYCSKHKKDGMIDISTKKCANLNCQKKPSYNIEGEKKGLYCADHKEEGMFDIITKRCVEPNCKKIATYNNEEETKRLYCIEHKKDGMINVVAKMCIYPNCKTRASHNIEGKTKAVYCSIHKLPEMINVVSKRCIYPNCQIIPNYNFEGDVKALYCVKHKIEGMLDIKHKKCKTQLCTTRVLNKYDGYCLFCYMNLFPDKPVSRNYKTKEYSVVEYVKTNFTHLTWISDKIIQDGCSKRRPDLLLDLGYQVIIIEIDENQHIDYDCSCENKRIMELSQDLNHRPIVFIRFNPDEYKFQDKTITSCWGINKNGICVVKKTKKSEWSDRLETLKEQINYWIHPDNKTDKTIEVVQLFYDR